MDKNIIGRQGFKVFMRQCRHCRIVYKTPSKRSTSCGCRFKELARSGMLGKPRRAQ